MKHKFWWLLAGAVLTVIFLAPVFFDDIQERTLDLIARTPYLAPLIIIATRIVGTVLAPLPGAPVAIASLAVLPWWQAWLYNLIGGMIGAIIAFLVARFFREPVVARFATLDKVNEWQEHLSRQKQLWGFVGLRLVAFLAFDFISYAAGLSRLPFWIFLVGTLVVDIPATFAFFYLGGQALEYGFIIFALFLVLSIILMTGIQKHIYGKKQN